MRQVIVWGFYIRTRVVEIHLLMERIARQPAMRYVILLQIPGVLMGKVVLAELVALIQALARMPQIKQIGPHPTITL